MCVYLEFYCIVCNNTFLTCSIKITDNVTKSTQLFFIVTLNKTFSTVETNGYFVHYAVFKTIINSAFYVMVCIQLKYNEPNYIT